MSVAYAEVIGDPIAQSKSPLIHRYWLNEVGLEGDFRAIRVAPADLEAYFECRRLDPNWRGCNVTIPHKEAVMRHLERIDPGASAIGAVNCIVREHGALVGRNTDIDGVAAALEGVPLQGRKVALIGAGGGARAAIHYLLESRVALLAIIVRNPLKAAHFRQDSEGLRVETWPFNRAHAAMEGAAAILNATPLGMEGAAPMSLDLLTAVEANAPGATLFDMAYKPLETEFLARGSASGGRSVDGLTMLIGQARSAFEAFFGHPAPVATHELRALLTS